MAGVDKKIKHLAAQELKDTKLKQNEKIPLLEEFVPLIEKIKVVNIEIKSNTVWVRTNNPNISAPYHLVIRNVKANPNPTVAILIIRVDLALVRSSFKWKSEENKFKESV